MKRIIYYHPHPIAENPSKGSELRPKKMKEAFQNIGYNVDLVVGDSLKRKKAIKEIKSQIINGISYEFLYAESSNMPIPLADPHHIPVRPVLDYKFFKYLNRKNIPIGFFYRDLYWRVDELKKNTPYYKHLPKQLFHWIEWFGVTNTVDHLFLPTTKMAKYFPSKWPKEQLSALLPGFDSKFLSIENGNQTQNSSNNKLSLFYVGGVKPPYYDITPLIKLVSELDGVELILCCQENDWNRHSHYYKNYDFERIEVVHSDSTQIAKYYKQADIFFDVRKPKGYLKNTIPIKVVESLGYEVPLILLKGTEPANFVKRQDAGWVVDSLDEAKALLQSLAGDRMKLKDKVRSIKEVKKRHTWEARAQQASDILTEKKLRN